MAQDQEPFKKWYFIGFFYSNKGRDPSFHEQKTKSKYLNWISFYTFLGLKTSF
jgi:hypothetical protein